MDYKNIVLIQTLFSYRFFLFFSIFVFLFGLSIGSFINVLIYRLPRSLSIIYPSSTCPSCGTRIKFYDNIPILSYVILLGKCRECGSRISPLYPAVELLTGVLLYLLFLKYFYYSYFLLHINEFNAGYFKDYIWGQLNYFFAFAFFIIIIISIAFIDLFHRIIPDILNVLLIVSGFVANIFLLHKSIMFSLYGFLIPGLFFYFIAFFYETVKKKEGLGGGDIKLIAGIGSYLGLIGAIFTIFVGSVFALVGFMLFFVFRKLTNAQAVSYDFKIPFGPFLSLAAVYYIFYGHSLIKIYMNFIKLY